MAKSMKSESCSPTAPPQKSPPSSPGQLFNPKCCTLSESRFYCSDISVDVFSSSVRASVSSLLRSLVFVFLFCFVFLSGRIRRRRFQTDAVFFLSRSPPYFFSFYHFRVSSPSRFQTFTRSNALAMIRFRETSPPLATQQRMLSPSPLFRRGAVHAD